MTASAAPAAGTPNPAPAAGGAPPAAGTPAAPAAFDWAANGFKDADLGYVQNKGWKGPADVVASYRDLEGFRGVPAERLLTLPEGDAPEAWGQFYDRLGRPKTPDDYKLPLPEGDDGAFAKVAGKWLHEAGLTTKQAQTVAAKWNEHHTETAKAAAEAAKKRDGAQTETLKHKWGNQYDSNWKIAEKAAARFEMSDETLQALRSAMGAGGAVEFLYEIGRSFGVDGGFVDGDGQPRTGFGMTREQALAKIDGAKNDQDFIAKVRKGDAAAKTQWSHWHKVAYGG